MVWDGTNLVKSKYLDQNTYYWKNCTIGTAPCTTADVSISSWDNSFNFWSQALGGDGRVELARCTGTDVSNAATDATISNCTTAGNIKGKLNADQTITPKLAGTANVIFHKTDMVYKGDTALNNKTLACFENCPNGTAIQAAVADPAQTTYSSAAYVNTSWGAWDPNNPNLSNINNQLDPSKVAQCEGLTNATPSVCQTTYINWGAPTCTANGGTSGVNNPGVDCCGDKSVTDQWGTYQQWACPSVSNSGGFYGYTFDATNYTLTDKKANKSVALTVSPTNMTDASWGFNSGLLFNSANFADTTTQYSWTNWDGTSASGNFIASIKCDWPYDMGNGSWADAGGGNWQFTPGTTTKYGTCAWRMWDTLNVFYTWETGPNDWNSFQTLTDSNGAVVTFDPPLHMSYTHTQTDSTAFDYSWNGSKMTLEYNGFGDLWGIPGTCWDMDTGSEAECGPGTRWVPAFSIPDGSTATYKDAQGNTQTAYIKALESEKRMRSSTSCTQTLTQYELPPASKYVAPDINGLPTPASNPNDPIASGAPSVIGGVVQ